MLQLLQYQIVMYRLEASLVELALLWIAMLVWHLPSHLSEMIQGLLNKERVYLQGWFAMLVISGLKQL